MIKFTKLLNPIGKRNKKADKKNWYIYKLKYMESAAFYKVAGGVGGKVLEFLYWKQSMNGNHFIPISNEHMEKEFGIRRQRIAEALKKLTAAGLVETEYAKGSSTKVRLINYIYKEDSDDQQG